MPYFDEPVGRVKIKTTGKNSQRYYTTKRLIRDLLSNTLNYYVRAVFIFRGMRDRSMRSGTELARVIFTHFGRYLYSTKCSWMIITSY